MVSSIYRWLIVLISCYLLLGCDDKEITFKPKKGQSYDYNVQLEVNLTADTAHGKQSASIETVMLANYQVLSANNKTAQILLKPELFSMSSNGMGGRHYSSLTASKDDELTAILKEGLVFNVEVATGKVLSMEANNKQAWAEFLKYSSGKKLAESLQNQLGLPIISKPIPSKIGAVVELDNFQGMENIKLTVDDIKNDKAQLTLLVTGTNQTFARMIVDIKTGWPIKMVSVSQMPLPDKNLKGNMQTIIIMEQGKQSFIDGIKLKHLSREDSSIVFDPALHSSLPLPINKDYTVDQVFPIDTGFFYKQGSEFFLGYVSDLSREGMLGSFKVDDLKLLDAKQQSIKMNILPVEGAGSIDYYNYLGGYLPLSWGDSEKFLEPVTEIQAKVSYYSSTMEALEVKLSSTEKTKVEATGLEIVFTPTNDPKVFVIDASFSKSHWVNMHYMKGVGENAQISRVNKIAKKLSWLDVTLFSLVDDVTIEEEKQTHYEIKFHELPKNITLYATHSSHKPTFQKELKFIEAQNYNKNVKLPPLIENTAYKRDESENLDTLQLFGGGKAHYLMFKLPKAYVPYCSIKVIDTPQVNNQPLHWKKSEFERDISNEHWNLLTENGIIQYFYGISVKSQLVCKGGIEWHDVPFQTNSDTPWLLDVRILSDYQFDENKPISTLFEQYRFLNINNEELLPALVVADNKVDIEKTIKEHDRLIKDFLVDDHYIRIAGIPKKIQKRVYTDKLFEKEWITDFEPIPCGEGDKACPR